MKFYLITLFVLINSQLSSQAIFDTLMLSSNFNILFDSDKYIVKDSFRSRLSENFKDLATQQNYLVKLNAHTDDVGSNNYNQKLAENRKESVKKILLNLGLNESQIKSNAFGELSPLFPNKHEHNRALNRRVEVELYQMTKVKSIATLVVDAKTKNGVKAGISMEYGENSKDYLTSDDGITNLLYPLGKSVQLETHAKGFFYKVINLKPNIISRLDTIIINLTSSEIGLVLSVDDLNFHGERCVLLNESLPALYQLAQFMKINDSTCIQVAGHINYPDQPKVETSHYLYDLSVSRANVVYDSLRKFGIYKGRMYTRGYGNWEMKFPNEPNDLERSMNRRVEIKIEECTKVAAEMNESVRNPSSHGYILGNKYYDKKNFENDVMAYHKSMKDKISLTVAKLLKDSIDLDKYTYNELVRMK